MIRVTYKRKPWSNHQDDFRTEATQTVFLITKLAANEFKNIGKQFFFITDVHRLVEKFLICDDKLNGWKYELTMSASFGSNTIDYVS